jgi:hypothetical protein
MYGFCRNTDLGISHFNFSSKNSSSKVYTCFAKVVAIVTQSTAKLALQFLEFATILSRIYKLRLKTLKGVRIILRRNPWKVLNDHRQALILHQIPWNYLGSYNVAHGAWGQRGLEKFRRPRRRARPGSGWGGSRGCRRSVWVLTCNGRNAGGRAWRRQGDAAAAVAMPVRGAHGQCKGRQREFLPSLGEMPGGLGGRKNQWLGSSARNAHGAVVAARCLWRCARRRAWLHL